MSKCSLLPGYSECGVETSCFPVMCDDDGKCGHNQQVPPDGTHNGVNWFCAAVQSGNYPVNRSFYDVSLQFEGDGQPYCCVKPKTIVQDCENNGTKNSDGTCDCSTAFVTLTDCHGGLVNYSGDGTNNPNPNGQKFNLNYSGKICDIPPTKLPDNFVKSFYYNNTRPEDFKECKITDLNNPTNNSICNGDTTTCTVNEYGTWNKTSIGGTICGDNNSQNNRDHQCGQY